MNRQPTVRACFAVTFVLLGLAAAGSAAKLGPSARAIDNTLYSQYLCRNKANGFRALVPGSCSQYYECQNQVSQLKTCPQFYNAVTGQCCSENPGCTEDQPVVPVPDDCTGPCCGKLKGYVVDINDPAVAYGCLNNQVVDTRRCTKGQVFNLVKLDCDAPGNCDGNVPCTHPPTPCVTKAPPCTTTTCATPATTTPSVNTPTPATATTCTTTTCTTTTCKPPTTTTPFVNTPTPATTTTCTTTTCTTTTCKAPTTTTPFVNTPTPATTTTCTTTTCTTTTCKPPTTTPSVNTPEVTPTTTCTTTTCTTTTCKPPTTTTPFVNTPTPATTTTCTTTTCTTTTCATPPTTTPSVNTPTPATTTTCTTTTCTTTTCATPPTTTPSVNTPTPATTTTCTTTTCSTTPCTTTLGPVDTKPPCTPTCMCPCACSEAASVSAAISPLKPSMHVRPAVQKPQQTTMERYANFACSDKSNGFMLASLRNCNDYYICRNGEALLVSCGSKYFNPLKGICDLPENTSCIQPVKRL